MFIPVGPLANLLHNSYLALVNWRSHLAWIIVFCGSPLFLFVLIALLNPYYALKFFVPSYDTSWWIGPTMFGLAILISLLTLPLSEVSQNLRKAPNRNTFTIVKLVFVFLFAILFWMISVAILILTPAALTMTEQMQRMH